MIEELHETNTIDDRPVFTVYWRINNDRYNYKTFTEVMTYVNELFDLGALNVMISREIVDLNNEQASV